MTNNTNHSLSSGQNHDNPRDWVIAGMAQCPVLCAWVIQAPTASAAVEQLAARLPAPIHHELHMPAVVHVLDIIDRGSFEQRYGPLESEPGN